VTDSRELSALIPLLYRADWTGWSFAAEIVERRDPVAEHLLNRRAVAEARRYTGGVIPLPVPLRPPRRPGQERREPAADAGPGWAESRARLLVAPGARYRFEPARPGPDGPAGAAAGAEPGEDRVTLVVSDGESCWVLWDGDDGAQYLADRELTPFDDIAAPARLLALLRLEVTGTVLHHGRAAIAARGTPRPVAGWPASAVALADHVDLLIDAELGTVLRMESVAGGSPVTVLALDGFAADPPSARDPGLFEPPADRDIEDCRDFGRADSDWGSGIRATEQAAPWFDEGAGAMLAGAGQAAVGIAARLIAREEPARAEVADDDAAMPVPGDELGDPRRRHPLSDQTLLLIAQCGTPALSLTAQAHRWIDADVVRREAAGLTARMHPARPSIESGFFGSEYYGIRLRGAHRRAAVRVAMPDRYRIDYLVDGRPRQPATLACDGQRLRKAYRNRVVESPARPVPGEFARLLDPAWLLDGWRLAEEGFEEVNGRPAVRVVAEPVWLRGRPGWRPRPAAWLSVAIDAELGIVLRQVSFVNGQQAARFELRGVSPRPAGDAGDFGLDADPAIPVVESDGGPIGDLDLPAQVRAAGDAAATVLRAGRSLFSRLRDESARPNRD